MVVLTVIFILYFIGLVILLTGWKRGMQEPPLTPSGREVLISVIVPARNEAMTLINLLDGLLQQDYRKFEVIVVNDGSEDETQWVATRFVADNVKVIHNKGEGKKAAITAGIRQARGSIIVTTDADCTLPPSWLSTIHAYFRNSETMMVFGGVRMQGENTFFDSLQALEFSSLIGTAVSTAALGFPTLCNGASLAFRKKVFTEVGGYKGNLHTPSGDDEFLMRKIQHRYKSGVAFLRSSEAVVTTRTQPDVREFLHQRMRWASKWRYNSSGISKGLGITVVLTQICFVVNWFFIASPFILQSLFMAAIKVILEAALLLQVCRFLQTRWNWLAFFALQVLYPVYVIIIAVTSFFVPFQWKNRIFKPAWTILQRGG